jgi:hypothetical protein
LPVAPLRSVRAVADRCSHVSKAAHAQSAPALHAVRALMQRADIFLSHAVHREVIVAP